MCQGVIDRNKHHCLVAQAEEAFQHLKELYQTSIKMSQTKVNTKTKDNKPTQKVLSIEETLLWINGGRRTRKKKKRTVKPRRKEIEEPLFSTEQQAKEDEEIRAFRSRLEAAHVRIK